MGAEACIPLALPPAKFRAQLEQTESKLRGHSLPMQREQEAVPAPLCRALKEKKKMKQP